MRPTPGRTIAASFAAFALATSAAAQQAPPKRDRELTGPLAGFGRQEESPMTHYVVSADRKVVLQFTEKHLLTIEPAGRALGKVPLGGEVTEGLHRIELSSPHLTADGAHVVGKVAEGSFRVYDAAKGTVVAKHDGVEQATCLAIHGDDTLLVGRADGKIELRKLLTGESFATLGAHEQALTWIATATTTGKRPEVLILTGSEDRTIVVSDFVTRRNKATLKLDHVPRLVAFDADEGLLATAAGEELQIWDVERARKKKTVKLGAELTCIDLAPGGKRYAAGTADGWVAVGKTSSSKPFAYWPTHEGGRLLTVAFLPLDDDYLATAGSRDDVCYWRADQVGKAFGRQRK